MVLLNNKDVMTCQDPESLQNIAFFQISLSYTDILQTCHQGMSDMSGNTKDLTACSHLKYYNYRLSKHQ